MPETRFALITNLPAVDKPVCFTSLEALARRVHQLRGDAALNLTDIALVFRDAPTERRGIAIYTQDDSGSRDRFVAYAWIDGASWRVLQAALYALQPNPAERAEAA